MRMEVCKKCKRINPIVKNSTQFWTIIVPAKILDLANVNMEWEAPLDPSKTYFLFKCPNCGALYPVTINEPDKGALKFEKKEKEMFE